MMKRRDSKKGQDDKADEVLLSPSTSQMLEMLHKASLAGETLSQDEISALGHLPKQQRPAGSSKAPDPITITAGGRPQKTSGRKKNGRGRRVSTGPEVARDTASLQGQSAISQDSYAVTSGTGARSAESGGRRRRPRDDDAARTGTNGDVTSEEELAGSTDALEGEAKGNEQSRGGWGLPTSTSPSPTQEWGLPTPTSSTSTQQWGRSTPTSPLSTQGRGLPNTLTTSLTLGRGLSMPPGASPTQGRGVLKAPGASSTQTAHPPDEAQVRFRPSLGALRDGYWWDRPERFTGTDQMSYVEQLPLMEALQEDRMRRKKVELPNIGHGERRESVNEYLERLNIIQLLQFLMNSLMASQPDDPASFLHDMARDMCEQQRNLAHMKETLRLAELAGK